MEKSTDSSPAGTAEYNLRALAGKPLILAPMAGFTDHPFRLLCRRHGADWAVSEMTDRYQKFAEYNVRDLKGYNKKIESIQDIDDPNKPQKMPQIVIIVDELADLMMVAPGDVEDAICRLAQLAMRQAFI